MQYNKITDFCTDIDLILKPDKVTSTLDDEDIKSITLLLSNIKKQIQAIESEVDILNTIKV
jgi:hypothetical protein